MVRLINIENFGNNNYAPGLFCKPVNMSLNHAMRQSLKQGENEIDAKKALRILKRIEFKSKVQSFFTKPVVIVTLSLALAVGGYIASALAAASIALIIFGAAAAVTGTLAVSISIRYACDGTLNRLSEAYSQRAHAARDHIDRINLAKAQGDEVKVRV